MNLMKDKNLMRNLLFSALSLAVIISYLYYIQKYSLNLPLWDDYDSALNFLLHWKAATGFSDKWMVLLQQHNEHRIVLTKLLEINSYYIFGQINFKYLIWWGNIFLFLNIFILGIFIFSSMANDKQKMPMLLILLSIMLCTVQWEAQLWGLAGIEMFGQIACSLWVLYLFSQSIDMPSKQNLFLLIALSFLNMFIGGGFIALFISLPLLALIFRKVKLSLLLLICFSFFIIIFFKILPYQFLSHPAPSIKNSVVFFFSFLGGGFSGVKILGHYFPFFVGIVLFFICAFYRKELKKNKFIFSWLAFMIMTDLLLVRTRSYSTEGIVFIASRYSPYSLITMVLLIYYLLLPRITEKAFNVFSIISFVAFMACFMQSDIYARYHVAKQSIYYPTISAAVSIYEQAKSEKIYRNSNIEKIIQKGQ